jgi:hypothetical protein
MKRLSDDDRVALGMLHASVEKLVSVEWSSENVGQGRGAGEAALGLSDLVDSDFAGCRFVKPRLPHLEALGVTIRLLQDYPGIVQFTGPTGEPLSFRSVNPPVGLRLDKEHAGTAFLDLTRLGPTIVSQGQVSVLVVGDAEALSIGLLQYHDNLSWVSPPNFEDWLRSDTDAWLLQAVQDRASVRRLWDVAASVGVFARLFEPDSVERAREMAGRMRKGSLVETFAAPRRWARELATESRRVLEAAARDELAEIEEDIRALRFETDDTVTRVLRVCHRRDDVEGVRLLLREATGADVLAGAATLVDQLGNEWRLTLPFQFLIEDERLRRIALADPQAWWRGGDD